MSSHFGPAQSGKQCCQSRPSGALFGTSKTRKVDGERFSLSHTEFAMHTINRLTALEILDSRGRPTVQATCELVGGGGATVSIPSGASTGAAEALELRDGDLARYRGLGCRQAVHHINAELNDALAGHTYVGQSELDRTMLSLDGTANKARLGANAILAVSLAFARAVANADGIGLAQHFANILNPPENGKLAPLVSLPRPTINLFSGGKHAGSQVPIQDVLVVPASARTIDEALAMTYSVFQAATELIEAKYGMRSLTADEGGLAPPFANATAMLDDAISAIHAAGLRPGPDVVSGARCGIQSLLCEWTLLS